MKEKIVLIFAIVMLLTIAIVINWTNGAINKLKDKNHQLVTNHIIVTKAQNKLFTERAEDIEILQSTVIELSFIAKTRQMERVAEGRQFAPQVLAVVEKERISEVRWQSVRFGVKGDSTVMRPYWFIERK